MVGPYPPHGIGLCHTHLLICYVIWESLGPDCFVRGLTLSLSGMYIQGRISADPSIKSPTGSTIHCTLRCKRAIRAKRRECSCPATQPGPVSREHDERCKKLKQDLTRCDMPTTQISMPREIKRGRNTSIIVVHSGLTDLHISCYLMPVKGRTQISEATSPAVEDGLRWTRTTALFSRLGFVSIQPCIPAV